LMTKRPLEEGDVEEGPRPEGLSLQKRRKTTLPAIGTDGSLRVAPYRNETSDEGHVGKKKLKRFQANEKKAQKEKQKKFEKEKEKNEKHKADPTIALVDLCKREKLPQIRIILAKVAEKILSMPEKFLETYFPAFFKIQDAIERPASDLAALSAVAVINNLLPGTKIGELQHLEGIKLSFKVEAQKKFDKDLLSSYSETLNRLIQGVKRDPKTFGSALASLGRTAFHFNHRKKLLSSVTITAARRDCIMCREECLETIRHVFEHDASLEASVEIVQALAFLARGKDKLSPELIDALLVLRLDRSEEAVLHEEKNEDEEIVKELQEAQIRHCSKHLKKLEVALLTDIIVIFLRVLRTKQLHSSEVIAACLRGLANKALLVNIELLVEILEELRLVIEEAITQHDAHVALLGIHCAFTLLQGPGRALTTNMSWLGNSFVQALSLALPYIPDQEKALLPCLAGSQIPQVFPKESMGNQALLQEALFALIAHLEPANSLKAFSEAERQLRRFGTKLSPILDVDGGLFGVGGARERPISVYWHLRALQHHLLPSIRENASSLQPQAGQVLRRAAAGTGIVAKECHLLTSTDFLDLPFPPKSKKPTRVDFWKLKDLRILDKENEF